MNSHKPTMLFQLMVLPFSYCLCYTHPTATSTSDIQGLGTSYSLTTAEKPSRHTVTNQLAGPIGIAPKCMIWMEEIISALPSIGGTLTTLTSLCQSMDWSAEMLCVISLVLGREDTSLQGTLNWWTVCPEWISVFCGISLFCSSLERFGKMCMCFGNHWERSAGCTFTSDNRLVKVLPCETAVP